MKLELFLEGIYYHVYDLTLFFTFDTNFSKKKYPKKSQVTIKDAVSYSWLLWLLVL